MVDVWQPADLTNNTPDLTVLQKLATAAVQLELQGDVSDLLNDQQLASARSWMQFSEENWQAAIEQLSNDERLQLATFYTVAEVKLSGFEARDKNPAIWIFRYLKKTQQLPEKDFIKALKNKTDNRFIPYGSVL